MSHIMERMLRCKADGCLSQKQSSAQKLFDPCDPEQTDKCYLHLSSDDPTQKQNNTFFF